MENRPHRLAERLRGRALMDAGINRVVGEPFRFGNFCAMIFCSRARDGEVLLSARNARPSP
jgi:hypothetical protein